MRRNAHLRRGVLFVLSAPSGCGKTTVSRRLAGVLPRLKRSISVTTRPPRYDEADGRDYFFVSRQEFLRKRRHGEFLEWATNFGALYGTPKTYVEKMLQEGSSVLLTIDVKGARQAKKKMPGSIHIFLMPPSLAALQERLEKRGTDSGQDVQKRLAIARQEIAQAERYDYIVINENIRSTVADVRAIIEHESRKRKKQ